MRISDDDWNERWSRMKEKPGTFGMGDEEDEYGKMVGKSDG